MVAWACGSEGKAASELRWPGALLPFKPIDDLVNDGWGLGCRFNITPQKLTAPICDDDETPAECAHRYGTQVDGLQIRHPYIFSDAYAAKPWVCGAKPQVAWQQKSRQIDGGAIKRYEDATRHRRDEGIIVAMILDFVVCGSAEVKERYASEVAA